MKAILIIEPTTGDAETIAEYLKSIVKPVCTHDAQSAVLAADKDRPSLVILELAMAAHNGIAFLQEFRSYSDWSDIPVIIHSHIPRDDTGIDEAEWQKYGVVEYLYKPTTNLAKLKQTVSDYL